MMNHTANGAVRISHLWLIIFTFALVPLLSLPVYSAAHAAMSGTSIGNQASATYTDGSGVSHTVTSNVVYTIVQQVSSLTLTSDNNKYSTAGGLVSFPHTLTNTGNGTDSFALTVTQATTDSFDITNISIYPDANGDGIADSGAVAITNTGAIPADGVFKFVVVGTLPPGAGAGSAIIQLTGTSAFNGTQIANNTDTVTVTSNAVINVTKYLDSYHGLAGSGPYTFTLTYTNSGNSAATNVIVVDAIPAGMTYIAGSGRWSGSGGTALTDSIAADAAGITYDYDVTAIGKITAVIANIGTGTSGTLTFQVNINASASSGNINNTALYQYNDGSGTTVSGTTNNVPFTVDPTSSLTITGATIQSSSQGSTVPFTNLITNTGNSIDTFDITLGNNTYPIGSTIVLYHSDGATPLLDTNGNGIPDTGPVAPGSSYSVVVKVSLPADAWGNKGYAIEKTATSTNDPTKTATATDKLNLINRSTVDLTNNLSISNGATAANGVGPGPEGNAITTKAANPAVHVDFDLYVNNTSAVADTYVLQVSTDPSFATISLPAGWVVTFENDVETIITNTGIIAPGGFKHVHTDIATPTTTPAGNYHLYYRVYSPTTGASDIKHDAVTINQMRSIAIVPNNSGQIYPGGSIVYTHTITNNGNVIEGDSLASDISLTVVDSLSGFSSAIYWDKNNNGVLDNGDPIINNLDSMTGGTNGANTTPGLAPGASATLFLKVYSPAGATPGSVDSAVITVTTSQGNYSTVAPAPTQATDNSTVIAGFIRLLKEQAIDAAADGTPDSAYSQANITTGAIPGCGIRYKITVTNTGTASVTSVVINDATPAFTTFNIGDGSITPTGTAVFTKDAGATYHECVGTNGSHPANGIAGTISANLGTLNPGQTATVYFEVKIVQ